MRVLGIVGSMRKNGQTDALVRRVVDAMSAASPSLTAEFLHAADWTVSPCRVTCSAYCRSHPFECSIEDDVPVVLRQMADADAIVLGVPQYFRAPPARFHALAERLISASFFHESQGDDPARSPVAGTPCGLVAVAEYSNPHGMLEYLHDFATLLGMRPILLDRFPYLGVGGHGVVEDDDVFHPFERTGELAAGLLRALTPT